MMAKSDDEDGERDGFLVLARAQAENSGTRRARRALLYLGVAGALLAALFAVVVTAAGDAGRWGARRYARATLALGASRGKCDYGLRRTYLWLGPQASRAMCVTHHGAGAALPGGRAPVRGEVRFLVVGDWGRDGMCCQRDVAAEMDAAASAWGPQFVVGTGDNFYPIGIEKPSDAQVQSSWGGVYGEWPALKRLRWLHVAGNHDHAGNVMAQVALGRAEKRWHLPALRYYEKVGDDVFVAFVDTTPMYYLPTQMGKFRMNMTDPALARRAVAELDAKLAASSARWKIVVGHHPLHSTGHHSRLESENLERMQMFLKPVFRKHKIPAYFCGHEHSLEHAVSEDVHYFVSGAGSKVRVITNYVPENRFAVGRQGFMAVSILKDEMRVYAVDMAGVILHTAIVPLRK